MFSGDPAPTLPAHQGLRERGMPEPIRQDIRFCTTPDGVQLAMCLYGAGPPIVRAATWMTHLERDVHSSLALGWIEALSRRNTYITYDQRGCGLSSRRVDEVSMEAWIADLKCVIDALGLERCALVGNSHGAAVAVAFAARYPERVSALLLYGSYASSYLADPNPSPRMLEEAEAMFHVARMGWGRGSQAFRQVFVSKFMPRASPADQRMFDESQRLSADGEMAERCLRAMFRIDVRAEVPKVRCPTLVFHARNDQLTQFEAGRKLAATIPGARFVPVDSDNHLPFSDEPCWPQVVREMSEFLARSGVAQAGPAPRLTPRQAEVLRLVAQGQTDKAVARGLALSPRTVEMHMAGALKALDCGTRAEAVARAVSLGLISTA